MIFYKNLDIFLVQLEFSCLNELNYDNTDKEII